MLTVFVVHRLKQLCVSKIEGGILLRNGACKRGVTAKLIYIFNENCFICKCKINMVREFIFGEFRFGYI